MRSPHTDAYASDPPLPPPAASTLPGTAASAPRRPRPQIRTQIRLRLYHHFEKPRNGRSVLIDAEAQDAYDGHEQQLTASVAAIRAALAPLVDASRYEPHVYDGAAECYVALPDDGTVSAAAAAHASEPARLDVQLLPTCSSASAPPDAAPLAHTLLCDSSATSLRASWFGIGIARGKVASNHGSLFRSALQFGASLIFTVGARYGRVDSAGDVYRTPRQIPCMAFADGRALLDAVAAADSAVVAIEYGGTPLDEFVHPKRAIYVLGAEDAGVPPSVVAAARFHVAIPTADGRPDSLNVAAAGSIVLYDRLMKERARGRSE